MGDISERVNKAINKRDERKPLYQKICEEIDQISNRDKKPIERTNEISKAPIDQDGNMHGEVSENGLARKIAKTG